MQRDTAANERETRGGLSCGLIAARHRDIWRKSPEYETRYRDKESGEESRGVHDGNGLVKVGECSRSELHVKKLIAPSLLKGHTLQLLAL